MLPVYILYTFCLYSVYFLSIFCILYVYILYTSWGEGGTAPLFTPQILSVHSLYGSVKSRLITFRHITFRHITTCHKIFQHITTTRVYNSSPYKNNKQSNQFYLVESIEVIILLLIDKYIETYTTSVFIGFKKIEIHDCYHWSTRING